MKHTMTKAILITLSALALTSVITTETNAKTAADFAKDGYSIVLTEESIVEGEDILDYQAPGFSINDAVIFYDTKIHDPKVSVVKNHGTEQAEIVSEDCYTVEVPKGRQYIGHYTYKITFKGELAKYGTVEKTLVITANNRVINVKAKAYSKKVKVTWAPFRTKYSNKSVAGYSISYEKTDALDNQDWKVFKKHKTVTGRTKNSMTIKGLKSGTSYGFMVRPFFNVNGKRIYGNWSEITYITVK